MRIMTWNLWWRFGPWEERERGIETVVRAEAPDVLFLQEVWSHGGESSAHRLAAAMSQGAMGQGHDIVHEVALTDDPFADQRGERPGFHNAIVSRWPLTDVVSHPLPGGDGNPGHRRVLTARAQVGERSWPLLCTHLAYRFDESALREAQCREILRIVDEIRGDPDTEPPVLVGGDFNAAPDSDEIRLLTGRRAAPRPNLVLSDCWEHVGAGPGITWRDDNPYHGNTAWPNRRLDYVFVSWPRPKPLGNPVAAHLAGIDAVGGVHPSDHAAVVVEVNDGRPVSS
jgi:endonuclease/exonuclease/phosphatase family metal-dependent hydrolase